VRCVRKCNATCTGRSGLKSVIPSAVIPSAVIPSAGRQNAGILAVTPAAAMPVMLAGATIRNHANAAAAVAAGAEADVAKERARASGSRLRNGCRPPPTRDWTTRGW
jgi:hypothetical protein